ncbi:MAG: MFS transporter [Rhizomicrobium sp.]
MLRFVTGLGIGGTLSSINTIVVEYSSQKRKDITVAVMTVGYPIGATIVGIASVYLIEVFGWRSVFVFGGAFFRRTSMICGAYFLTMLSFNFRFNWTPKVLVDQGFSLRFGISGSVLMNLGSVAGRPSARTGDKAFRTACARYSAARRSGCTGRKDAGRRPQAVRLTGHSIKQVRHYAAAHCIWRGRSCKSEDATPTPAMETL